MMRVPQACFVAAEIENQPIVTNEVNGGAERSLHVSGSAPPARGRGSIPCTNRGFSLRVPLPELLECSESDDLHTDIVISTLACNKSPITNTPSCCHTCRTSCRCRCAPA